MVIKSKIKLPIGLRYALARDYRLDNKIFETWDAKISEIFYKPQVTPENIVSYKIIADFNDLKQNDEIPKIGLRGTAKIYSQNVTLFFYLFRKPITSLRQLIAW